MGFCFNGISRSNHFSPFSNSIGANEFQANSKIRCHEVDEVGKKWFGLVFLVKLLSIGSIHLKHFEVANNKLLFDSLNDFADIEIGIRFNHSIGS